MVRSNLFSVIHEMNGNSGWGGEIDQRAQGMRLKLAQRLIG